MNNVSLKIDMAVVINMLINNVKNFSRVHAFYPSLNAVETLPGNPINDICLQILSQY